jgi:hypothetical protein
MDQSDVLPTLPVEIRVEPILPDGTRYILPRRPLGSYRWLALVPLAFGLFSLIFFWHMFAVFAAVRFNPIALPFMAFEALFVVSGGLAPIAIAAAMFFGHSSIIVQRGELRAIERLGPLRWTRRFPSARINRLSVTAANESTSVLSSMDRFALIRIELLPGKRGRAAIGYPRGWLVPLANELSRQISVLERNSFERASDQPIEVVPVEVSDDSLPVERIDRPAGSKIVMRQTPDNVVFEIPPMGFRGGALAIFIFAGVWLAFAALVTFGLLFMKHAPKQPDEMGTVATIGFMAIFWLIGGGFVSLAVSLSRQSAAIAVAGGQCLVIRKGLFSEKKQVWEADELAAVKVGRPQGSEDQSVQLQFISRYGKRVGMFSGRKRDELEWLATHLRKALDLSASAEIGAVHADVDVQPPGSTVVFQQLHETLTISVPRLPGRRSTFLPVAVFWNFILAVFLAGFLFGGQPKGPERAFIMLFFVPFLLIGIGLILGAIHMAIQRAEIAVAGERLFVLRIGIFGKRRNEWAASDLKAVRAGPSSTSVGNERQMQLQIAPRVGAELKLLTGRDPKELAWIATLLRRGLNLPATTEKQPPEQTATASTADS